MSLATLSPLTNARDVVSVFTHLFFLGYPVSPDLCHIYGCEGLLIVDAILSQYSSVFWVFQGGVGQCWAECGCALAGNVLTGIKPQCEQRAQRLVVVLSIQLACSHGTVVLGLAKRNARSTYKNTAWKK